MLIGISRYKVPEFNLQYAAADARLMSEFQRSPRGGVSAENILLLTDGEATSLKIRRGLQDLKRRASKNDTVMILIAGRGTVDAGSKNAFILSYDSDPQDLKGTALAVGELQALVTEQFQSAARVILFLDVCRSGAISASSTPSLASRLEGLGGARGKVFGFLAGKPNQVSIKSPQFGGGHGVFSYYLVKGMQGEADKNGDR
ncbi:MAG TPA: caspase family protein, partial [Bryobacteraceae bacterium]|nr:caspase family protein [Bryobacteraceae bacterium]